MILNNAYFNRVAKLYFNNWKCPGTTWNSEPIYVLNCCCFGIYCATDSGVWYFVDSHLANWCLTKISDAKQFKVLIFVLKAQRGIARKYLSDLILHPISVSVFRPLWSSDRLDLFVPRVRTGMDFHLQSVPTSTLVVYPHLSLNSIPVFPLVSKRTGSASERLMLREVQGMNTYNTMQ